MKEWAAAKINLSLRILGKRRDGFHELETLMTNIRLADALEFDFGGSGLRISCSDTTLPTDESNLVARAVRAFEKKTNLRADVAIHIDKHIPHGAGLGGGSSDAATVLRVMDAHFGTGLDATTLIELAAEVGSDVAFFLRGGAAWCRGRGEQTDPVSALKPMRLILFKPPFGVETAWAYRAYALNPETSGDVQLVRNVKLTNDMEGPVFRKFLLLPILKEWLRRQPEVEGSLMAGSGSTVFGVLRVDADADALSARARQMFGETLWCCETETV